MNEESELLKDIKEIVERRKDRVKEEKIEAPLSQVEAIKNKRTTPGEGSIYIGGRPVDVWSVEDMLIRTSPSDLHTLTRMDSNRIIEMMRNNSPILDDKGMKVNWGILLLLLLIGGGAIFFIWFLLPIVAPMLGI